VARLIVKPHVLWCFLRPSLTEVPSLRRSYPASSDNGPLRHPIRPGLALASCQLIPTAITAGASCVAPDPLCLHAVATTPAGPMELIRSYCSIVAMDGAAVVNGHGRHAAYTEREEVTCRLGAVPNDSVNHAEFWSPPWRGLPNAVGKHPLGQKRDLQPARQSVGQACAAS
jgi:hypothetical protein